MDKVKAVIISRKLLTLNPEPYQNVLKITVSSGGYGLNSGSWRACRDSRIARLAGPSGRVASAVTTRARKVIGTVRC